MWNGKNKAVTFSFDDGVLHDKIILKLFNELGLKATFNINSSLFGLEYPYESNGIIYDCSKINVEDVKTLYVGHEVASHTLTHSNLTKIKDASITWQVEEDRKVLSELVGYNVVGFAYPGGGGNNNEHVAEIIKNTTGVKYARTTICTHNYDLQTDLIRFNPTVYWGDNLMYNIIDNFISLKTEKPQLLYIWGHSYELNDMVNYDKFALACKKLSKCKDVYFGTNKDVLL